MFICSCCGDNYEPDPDMVIEVYSEGETVGASIICLDCQRELLDSIINSEKENW